MQLDLTKLFPKSCKENGISYLKVNYEDITFFARQLPAVYGDESKDIVKLKSGEEYIFASNDQGIFILGAILCAKEILNEFEQTKKAISGINASKLKQEKEIALNYLQMVLSIYS